MAFALPKVSVLKFTSDSYINQKVPSVFSVSVLISAVKGTIFSLKKATLLLSPSSGLLLPLQADDTVTTLHLISSSYFLRFKRNKPWCSNMLRLLSKLSKDPIVSDYFVADKSTVFLSLNNYIATGVQLILFSSVDNILSLAFILTFLSVSSNT